MGTARSFLRRNAWPAGIVGVTLCFFIADGTLIYSAVRDTGFSIEDNYYEKAVHYDELQAKVRRAQDEGLRAEVSVGQVPVTEMPRPVDIRIVDKQGQPVTDLQGTVTAIRPSDGRLRNAGQIIAVPEEKGLYRLLLKVPVSGLWEFQLEARRGQDEYRMVVRKDVRI